MMPVCPVTGRKGGALGQGHTVPVDRLLCVKASLSSVLSFLNDTNSRLEVAAGEYSTMY